MIYGSSRLSTDGQSAEAQVAALTAAGAGRVFREIASGAKTNRSSAVCSTNSTLATCSW